MDERTKALPLFRSRTVFKGCGGGHTSHRKVYSNEFVQNSLRCNMGIKFFDIHGYGNCQIPITLHCKCFHHKDYGPSQFLVPVVFMIKTFAVYSPVLYLEFQNKTEGLDFQFLMCICTKAFQLLGWLLSATSKCLCVFNYGIPIGIHKT